MWEILLTCSLVRKTIPVRLPSSKRSRTSPVYTIDVAMFFHKNAWIYYIWSWYCLLYMYTIYWYFFLYLYVAYFFLWGVYTRWIKQVKQQVYCREFHWLATGWRARQWSRSRQNKKRRTRSLLICLHAKLAAGLPFYRLSPFIDIVSVFFIRLSFCIAHLVSAVVSRWRCLLKKGERGRGWFMNHAWSAISPCSCLRRHHVCLC